MKYSPEMLMCAGVGLAAALVRDDPFWVGYLGTWLVMGLVAWLARGRE